MNTFEYREYILEQIDWKKVEAIYTLLGHKWYMNDGLRVPTATELRRHASGLLRDVKPGDALDSGRMTAEFKGGILKLEIRTFEACRAVG